MLKNFIKEKTHMKKTVLLFALILCAMLTGCGQLLPSRSSKPSQETSETVTTLPAEQSTEPTSQKDESPEPASQTDESMEPASQAEESMESASQMNESTESAPQPDESMESVSQAEGQTATLYIGTMANGFTEYPMTYEGALTPDALIQGIADLTGWNLTLAEPVISGKGGMSVCLSNESALFTGPPEPQNENFFMFSQENLAETLLDSIQKTLQMGFTGEGGNPDLLDIWYYMEGSMPLELPSLGLSWPIDQPYQWADVIRE